MNRSFMEALDRAPQAHSVDVFFCDGPECKRPHVVLLDNEGMPIAQFVCPDVRADGTGFFHNLQAALYRSAVERGR